MAVALDFAPVLTKDKEAGELHTPEFHRIYSGSIAAGDHVLVVDIVHDCAPRRASAPARTCTVPGPSRAQARTPTTLELRAYTEPEDGEIAAHPAVEMSDRR